MKSIYLILLLIILDAKSHVTSQEPSEDLEKNESQIEIPPLSVDVVEPELHIPENVEIDNASENYENPNAPEEPDVPDTPVNKSQEEMIPVFSEWTQQQIQEAEKKLIELTNSNSTETNKEVKNDTLAKHQIVKMRQKNYASPDCGAKILASNPEAQSTSSVLTDKDEYLLSPCTDRIWFVVELCDSLQAQRVELANFELFSSPLKTVTVSVSNRFPTRDWTIAGQFEAKSERDVQVLNLSSTLFGKFIRVDLTYTNTEHYCPLSFFRVFGTSEIEAFEVENEVVNIEDDDDFDHHVNAEKPNKNNLFDRAGAAVMSIVQKAAEVLVKSNGNGTKVNETSIATFSRDCMSLSRGILCNLCSKIERDELDALISCKNAELSRLVDEATRGHLIASVACGNVLGIDLKTDTFVSNSNFIMSILPSKYIAALCNIVASDLKILPLRLEDIPGINSSLVSKKDEISLKNISKVDPGQCKQESFETPTANFTNTTGSDVETGKVDGNSTLSGDELNIFNVVEMEKAGNDAVSSTSEVAENEDTKPPEEPNSEENQGSPGVVVPPPIADPTKPQTSNEIKSEKPEDRSPEVKSNQDAKLTGQPEVNTPEVKANGDKLQNQPEMKNNPDFRSGNPPEIKINGDFRSSNPPESVFLRLSNRIKTLEKNMTLSTQYLEELSRRYKKQIEDLQQSYLKLQSSIDEQNQKKRDRDRIDFEDKKILREMTVDLSKKSEYMEVILIVLSVFFTFQSLLVIALFKRISILRKAFAAQNQQPIPNPPPSPSQRARKRSKQRMRKISAPNILTQRSPVKNEFVNPEFTRQPAVLSRTVSVPNKLLMTPPCPPPKENKENYDEMQAMLEENDEILIPGFSDLKINDEESLSIDTASTASARSNEKKENSNSNKSFKFKRRLSSPFQLKKTSMKKSNSGQLWKKAMSESPQRLPVEGENIQKSKSFEEEADQDGSVKFKKSNSFKKLFKKLF